MKGDKGGMGKGGQSGLGAFMVPFFFSLDDYLGQVWRLIITL